MANIFGKSLTRTELLKRVGNLDQIASVRALEYTEGKASGLRAYEVQNGALSFTVLPGRCMDIGTLRYKGVPLHFIAKQGTTNPLWSFEGDHAQRSIMGGMMFTCGLRNVGTPVTVEGERHVVHGRIRTTPADHVSCETRWEGDEYVMRCSGEMREAVLFGENLVLRRVIETKLGSDELLISDEIENQGFQEQPLMLLYHFNVGYPLLDDGARLLLPPHETTPRDAYAIEVEQALLAQNPQDGLHERVYYHCLPAEDGRAAVAFVNESLGLGLSIEYDVEALPHLVQWKSMASGDYAMGIEPSNCHVEGLEKEKRTGTLCTLPPMEKRTVSLRLRIHEGDALSRIINAYLV